MKISVVVPCYDNPDYLDICLQSLTSACTEHPNDVEVLVVLDGKAETSSHLKFKYHPSPNIKFIEFPENKGLQMATNIGVWYSKFDTILILNDDNVAPLNWFERLAQFDLSRMQAISINQIEPGIFRPVGFGYPTFNAGGSKEDFDFQQFAAFEKQCSTSPQSRITTRMYNLPMLITKAAYMAVGGWDTVYDSPHVCDWDFYVKLYLHGIMPFRINDVAFYHFSGKATKIPDSDVKEAPVKVQQYNVREQAALELFASKWGLQLHTFQQQILSPDPLTVRGITF